MRRTRNLLRLALLATLAAAPARGQSSPEPSPQPAGGIRTDFGDVLIENLGIGRSYNLREIAGRPMKVTNSGAGTINLIMDTQIPTDAMITEIRRELGFKPIPSIDWVTLSRSQFVLPPGESAYTDVIINIPDDPSLYGKKFQASIYSRTTGDGFLQLGVFSHIQMTIVKSPEVQKQQDENRKRGFVGSMEYTLLPDKLVVTNVPQGKRIDIRKDLGRSIMIANSGAEAIELRAKVVRVGDTPLSLQAGYEEPSDLGWLSLASKVYRVEPASFTDPGLVLELPKKPALSGKRLMFVIKVEPADPEVVGVTYYGKVYVEVK